MGYDAGYVAACPVAPAEHTAGDSVSLLSGDWVRFADGYYGYDFFLAEDNTIYGVRLENKTLTPIFDGFQSGVDLNHIAFFSVGDTIMICDNRSMDLLVDQYVLLMAEAAETGAQERRTELRLATLNMDSYLQEAITTFNRTNENYVISVENYSQYGDGGASRMRMDLMSGNLPDMINLAGFRGTAIDTETYLLNLLPYVQTSFGESMEPLQSNVVEALMRDGKLFYITPIYHTEAIITAETNISEPLTLRAFDALLESGDHEHLTNEAVLSALTKYGIHDLIHTEEQTMDTDALRSMLEIANRFPDKAITDEVSGAERLISGDVPFLEAEIFSLRNFRTMYYDMGGGGAIRGMGIYRVHLGPGVAGKIQLSFLPAPEKLSGRPNQRSGSHGARFFGGRTAAVGHHDEPYRHTGCLSGRGVPNHSGGSGAIFQRQRGPGRCGKGRRAACVCLYV